MSGPISASQAARITHEVAKYARQLPHDLQRIGESDPPLSLDEVRDTVIDNDLYFSWRHVATFLRIHYGHDRATHLTSQVMKIFDPARTFVEAWTARLASPDKHFKFNRREGGMFLVVCTLVAEELDAWAAQMEGYGAAANDGKSADAVATKSDGSTTKKPLLSQLPNPSLSMSKNEAAAMWGGDMTVKKLTGRMKAGKLRAEKINRQSWFFCLDDFPPNARKKLMPTRAN